MVFIKNSVVKKAESADQLLKLFDVSVSTAVQCSVDAVGRQGGLLGTHSKHPP